MLRTTSEKDNRALLKMSIRTLLFDRHACFSPDHLTESRFKDGRLATAVQRQTMQQCTRDSGIERTASNMAQIGHGVCCVVCAVCVVCDVPGCVVCRSPWGDRLIDLFFSSESSFRASGVRKPASCRPERRRVRTGDRASPKPHGATGTTARSSRGRRRSRRTP